LERFSQREHVKNVAVYDVAGAVINVASSQPSVSEFPTLAARAATLDTGVGEFLVADDGPVYVYALPLHENDKVTGALAVVNDASDIESRLARSMRDLLVHATVQILVTVPLALLLVRWTYTDPLARLASWLRTLHAGHPQNQAALPRIGVFEELSRQVAHLARDLGTARASAEREARLRESHAAIWTAERLSVSVRDRLGDQPMFVVANREPYMHVHGGKSTEVIVPASGLVTAIEPILIACHGTWVAHGAGNADRTAVDEHDRLRVPPDRPSYTLRRVWLEPEEEQGYYYGFSNEGLWPLCHIAHTRPIFRAEDWRHYQRANELFAETVIDEMAGSRSPILLAHDYHFALLPRLVKQARPDARVALFWHIPWPNPEAFGICPWQRELIDGLLGADLIGFHTQSHCNNFLETVDRGVEALTNWDRFAVNRRGHVTSVRPYPISVAFPAETPPVPCEEPEAERAALLHELGISADLLAVGVDRVDYTKGILERFRAVERLMEIHPQYRGHFTLIQIGAPSRTHIGQYQKLLNEVVAQAARINNLYQTGRWQPIMLLMRHHSHQEIARWYQVADACLVTSIHDGMNLVAKEFVAAREDNRGVLVLSTFTGAALELTDALLVNPYDVDQTAEAIHRALRMPSNEQADRMRRMRRSVGEHNVFRWAERLLSDLVDIRVDAKDRMDVA
jgi:trehalose 6-phosphate synthase